MGLFSRLFEGLVDTVDTDMKKKQINNEPLDKENSTLTSYDITPSRNPMLYDWYQEAIKVATSRNEIYKEYDAMDTESPEIASALDVYADNVIQADGDSDEVLEIITDNEKIKELFQDFKNKLNLDNEIWSIARNLAKYGEDFEEVIINKDKEITRIKNLDGRYIIRNENEYGILEENAFSQINPLTMQPLVDFKEWQILHFRIRKDRTSRYGEGILYPLRKIYKQLSMMEDAIVITRLTRAPLRYAYLIDTDGLTPDETLSYIEKVKNKLRKRKTVDPKTGKMNINFNPMSIEEDIFLGVKQGSRADVKVLQGAHIVNLADIEYFQNKLFAGLKVPKAFLGFERDINAKATLTEQYLEFARTIRRIQLCIIDGMKKLFNLHLTLNGISPDEVDYTLTLPVLNTVDELRKWEIERIKTEIASTLKQVMQVPNVWIYKEFLELTNEEIEELDQMRQEEIEKQSELMQNLIAMNPQLNNPKTIEKLKNKLESEIKTLKFLTDWQLKRE